MQSIMEENKNKISIEEVIKYPKIHKFGLIVGKILKSILEFSIKLSKIIFALLIAIGEGMYGQKNKNVSNKRNRKNKLKV